jgi:hypothetical protein
MDIESEYSLKYKRRVKKQKNKKMVGDSILVKKQSVQSFQVSELNSIIEKNHQNNIQTLLLKGGRTEFFVTEDSHRYISPKQQYKKDLNYDYVDPRGYFDSVHFRYVKQYTASELQQKRLVAEFRNARDIATNFREALRLDLSPIRMWQVSLAGAVLFGMVSMSMIYKNLGQNAFAKGVEEAVSGTNDKVAALVLDGSDNKEEKEEKEQKTVEKSEKIEEKVVEEAIIEEKIEKNVDKKVVADGVQEKPEKVDEVEKIKTETIARDEQKTKEQVSVDSIIKKEDKKKEKDEKDEENKKDDASIDAESEYSLDYEAHELVDGYPIEKMLPYILEQDPEVAKYLIAIAKQESAWGKRVPVLNGQDCYNYWGYRGKRKLMGSGGHTCFNSRKDAVETVGKRLHELIYDYDRKTPERLIVWKCGSSCAGHSQEGVDRWINTIKSNYNKLSDVKTISKK